MSITQESLPLCQYPLDILARIMSAAHFIDGKTWHKLSRHWNAHGMTDLDRTKMTEI